MRCAPWSILVLVLLGACDSQLGDETLDITYDPCRRLAIEPASDATPAELESIEDAVDMWNGVAPTRLVLGGTAATPRLRIAFEPAAPVFHGVYRDELGDILINRGLENLRERTVTIAHELGHAFGFWHVDESERISVMNDGNLDVAPTRSDADQLGYLWTSCSDDAVARQALPSLATD